MTDRLQELRRQRDLLQQHLAWLDAEIAAETRAAPTHVPLTARPRSVTSRAPSATAQLAEEATATLLEQYGTEAQRAPARAKLGCWVVFLSAFALLGLAVAMWFLLRTR